jgi:hypothetical protein
MILVELMFAIMVAAVALIAIPLILLVLWLLFPHTMGVAVLLFVLLALVILARRRQVPMNHWYRY